MREPKLTFDAKKGEYTLDMLEMPFVRVLREIPSFLRLAQEHPKAKERLFPAAYDDADAEREWRRHANPEISHLLSTAITLVERDLTTIHRAGISRFSRLTIPAKHLRAWMSTLNAARLTIAEVYRIDEREMHPHRPLDPASERDAAVLNINLLGWIQELLVLAAP